MISVPIASIPQQFRDRLPEMFEVDPRAAFRLGTLWRFEWDDGTAYGIALHIEEVPEEPAP